MLNTKLDFPFFATVAVSASVWHQVDTPAVVYTWSWVVENETCLRHPTTWCSITNAMPPLHRHLTGTQTKSLVNAVIRDNTIMR